MRQASACLFIYLFFLLGLALFKARHEPLIKIVSSIPLCPLNTCRGTGGASVRLGLALSVAACPCSYSCGALQYVFGLDLFKVRHEPLIKIVSNLPFCPLNTCRRTGGASERRWACSLFPSFSCGAHTFKLLLD